MNALMEQELIGLDHLPLEETEDQEAAKERFKVKDLGGVNWCLRKLAALEAKLKEVRGLAAEEYDRIRQWERKETQGIEQQATFFKSLLEEFHRNKLKEDPKVKSITTPYGKLQLKKQQPEWGYIDDVLLEWLKTNRPDLVREKITYSTDKATIKREFQLVDTNVVDPGTGEIVPGITVQERAEIFSVEVV